MGIEVTTADCDGPRCSFLPSIVSASRLYLSSHVFHGGLTLDDWTLAQMEHAAGTAPVPLYEDVWYGLVERSEDHD